MFQRPWNQTLLRELMRINMCPKKMFISYSSSVTTSHRRRTGIMKCLSPKGNSPPNLPSNKRLATVRLQCLKNKIKASKQYSDQYKTFMEETINKGDAEPAPWTSEGQTEWYLPHHGIYHPRKPDKLSRFWLFGQMTWCFSKRHYANWFWSNQSSGRSNLQIQEGSCSQHLWHWKNVLSILCYSRIQKLSEVPLVKGGDLEKEPQEYRMAVHLFGDASSPGWANFGLKHLAWQHKTDYPMASTFVEKNDYVDDG